MPLDKNINHVLLIGAGPIIIGQACEFDYSGTQSCKALKEEGCKVTLVNSNPATIMTDPGYTDATFIEPITTENLEKIIERQRPDSILPTMGGQTALNCTLELAERNILRKHGVNLIGVSIDAIHSAENRKEFNKIVKSIGLKSPLAMFVTNISHAEAALKVCGLPAIIRASYSLGGKGGGIANNIEQFKLLCRQALEISPFGITVEKSIIGWKEYELEVMRDAAGNSIVICSIENFNPMGVHTGDSITVAPAQTLTDKEYQIMRRASFLLMDAVGMTSGGCNVQFAVNPIDGSLYVIEINPRVSRSSALASKATGYPIAKIATKIALGYTLDELTLDTTGSHIPASFEPTLDYIVTKIPKFNFNKFPMLKDNLSTKMKSVGEVMGVGRTFQQSLLKAISSLESPFKGLEFSPLFKESVTDDQIKKLLNQTTSVTLWYIAEAIRRHWPIEKVYELTKVDKWFLMQLKELVELEVQLSQIALKELNANQMRELKEKGFSDEYIAHILDSSVRDVREKRKSLKILPTYKHIDSTAGEYPTKISYFYSCYEEECELSDNPTSKIVVLGSGPNRIGQGIEFDYCCVQASKAIQKEGYESVMINSNPETVSTDYDTSDSLFFEPLEFEYVSSVIDRLSPVAVITQFGGLTSLSLTEELSKNGVKILGTAVEIIDLIENRNKFREYLLNIGLRCPPCVTAHDAAEAIFLANEIKYPLIARPSYIIGGTGIMIIEDEVTLVSYLNRKSTKFPLLLEHYLKDAIEYDVDAISDGTNVYIAGILEHIEPAGIHSGDSHCIYPYIRLSKRCELEISSIVRKVGRVFKLKGLFNIQLAIKEDKIYIIEINPRASRTVPFLSKATGVPLVQMAVSCLLGKDLPREYCNGNGYGTANNYFLKVPIFSNHILDIDGPNLGPEMLSTGEIMTIGRDITEVLLKAAYCNKTSYFNISQYSSVRLRNNKPNLEIYKLQDIYESLQ